MKVRDFLEKNKQFDGAFNELIAQDIDVKDIDVYGSMSGEVDYHTDNLLSINEMPDKLKVIDYEIMDKEDYSHTVLANSSISWEDMFEENDKILCILIKEEERIKRKTK